MITTAQVPEYDKKTGKKKRWIYLTWIQCDICNWTRQKIKSYEYSIPGRLSVRRQTGFLWVEEIDICPKCAGILGLINDCNRNRIG